MRQNEFIGRMHDLVESWRTHNCWCMINIEREYLFFDTFNWNDSSGSHFNLVVKQYGYTLFAVSKRTKM